MIQYTIFFFHLPRFVSHLIPQHWKKSKKDTMKKNIARLACTACFSCLACLNGNANYELIEKLADLKIKNKLLVLQNFISSLH